MKKWQLVLTSMVEYKEPSIVPLAFLLPSSLLCTIDRCRAAEMIYFRLLILAA